jgi:hypothetical protein
VPQTLAAVQPSDRRNAPLPCLDLVEERWLLWYRHDDTVHVTGLDTDDPTDDAGAIDEANSFLAALG